jgi:hypothetical protein
MLDSSGPSFVPEVSVMRARNYSLRKRVGEDATILYGLSAKQETSQFSSQDQPINLHAKLASLGS